MDLGKINSCLLRDSLKDRASYLEQNFYGCFPKRNSDTSSRTKRDGHGNGKKEDGMVKDDQITG